MDEKKEKVVGIIGGMGPESTAELIRRVFLLTKTNVEQDHIHIIADSNPKIPDRTAYLLGKGPSPVPALQETVKRLTQAGADLLAIPCNTAHIFYDDMQSATSVPILNMIECCAEWTKKICQPGDQVGLLATLGTIKAGTYAQALSKRGLQSILPTEEEQETLMEAIYGNDGVKKGQYSRPLEIVRELSEKLLARGAQAVIAGCTEISIIADEIKHPKIIDALTVLAKQIVIEVKGEEFLKEDL